MDPLGLKDPLGQLERRELLDPKVLLDSLVHKAHEGLSVHKVTRGPRAQLDQLDLKANVDLMVTLAIQDLKETQDPLDHEALLALWDPRVRRAYQDPQEHRVLRVHQGPEGLKETLDHRVDPVRRDPQAKLGMAECRAHSGRQATLVIRGQ